MASHIRAFYMRGSPSRHENKIVSAFHSGGKFPERLPDHSAGTVAQDGVADLFACGDTDPEPLVPVFFHIDHHKGGNKAFPLRIESSEIIVPAD